MELKRFEGSKEEWDCIFPGYCGYMRLYYQRHCWFPVWFENKEAVGCIPDDVQDATDKQCRKLAERWPGGCDFRMRNDVRSFMAEISSDSGRHLLETEDEHYRYLVLLDIRFGNMDYPIRVHTYWKGKGK